MYNLVFKQENSMSGKIIPPKRTREIASMLIAGKKCYIHIYQAKIFFVSPDEQDVKQQKKNAQLLEDVKKKPENYLQLGALPEEDLLQSMSDFAEGLKDNSKKKELKNALKRKLPIRNFTQAVESDFEISIYWTNYQVEWRQQWVEDFIVDAYNY